MIIFGVIIGWIISGVLAVYLAGYVDKIENNAYDDSVPGLFILGPFAIFIVLTVFIIGFIIRFISKSDFLTKVYLKGFKK